MVFNALTLFVGRNRWLKRPLLKFDLVPETGHIDFKNGEIKRLFLNPTDLHGPSYHVMYGGYEGYLNYERAEKEAILKGLPKNGVFFDIGANIGLFSLATAVRRTDAKIYAFEPHPQTFLSLQASVKFNGLKNITLTQRALGSKATDMSLFVNSSNAGGHTFVKETLGSDEIITGETKVSVITLDEFVEGHQIHKIDVMKIDVQGFEKEVLLGARKSLIKSTPTIMLECDNPQIVEDDYLQTILGSAHYKFRTLQDPLLHPLTELEVFSQRELSKGKVQTNLIFMR